MRTTEEDREFAAYIAGNLDRNRPGRNWRPLVDTAVGVSAMGLAPNEEVPYRRSLDYYDEMLPVWLDVDTTIRAKTNGAKSLDDFAKIFFGPPGGAPVVKPYTLDDVAAALNAVTPNDWKGFIQARVYRVTPHPPLNAFEQAGWRLVWNETPNWYESLRARLGKRTDVSFSLGMWVKNDGTITDVVYGSPAYAAGLMPGMKLTSVNGRKYDGEALREEIRGARTSTNLIDVVAEQASFSGTFHIDYHDGERYPHLDRIADRPDVLSDIMRPHAVAK